jgi:hypothetical protein
MGWRLPAVFGPHNNPVDRIYFSLIFACLAVTGARWTLWYWRHMRLASAPPDERVNARGVITSCCPAAQSSAPNAEATSASTAWLFRGRATRFRLKWESECARAGLVRPATKTDLTQRDPSPASI